MSAFLVEAGIEDSLTLVYTSQLSGAESHLRVVAFRAIFVNYGLTVLYTEGVSVILSVTMSESVGKLNGYGP